MIVQLRRRSARYPDLTPVQSYVVIGIEAGDLRLLNDHGKPYLYPSSLFRVIDPTRPSDWVTHVGDDGEEYAYPPTLNRPGFFEDFFEGQPQAVRAFWRLMNRHLTLAG